MSEFVTFVVLGLATGSIYGLAAMGLTLTYATSGTFNFAHGGIAALGGYVFVALHESAHWPWPAALTVTVAIVGVTCGLVLEALTQRLALAPLHLQIAATVGVLLVVVGGLTIIFGSDARFVPDFLPTRALRIAGARVGVDRLLLIALGTTLSVGLAAWVRYSRLGRRMRAVVDNPTLLDQCGTNPTAVRRWAWLIGCAFAAASGALLTPTLGLDPVLLTLLALQSFGAAAVGRFTSLGWTYLGGLGIGVAAALVTRLLGDSPGLAAVPAAVPFIIFAAVIAVRPPPPSKRMGLLGRFTARNRGRALVATVVAAVAVVMAVPWIVGARLPTFTTAAAFVTIFVSLALVVNQMGEVSLGHASFCAVGAVALSHLAGDGGVPWFVALAAAGAVSAASGMVVSLVFARFSGLTVALGTLGFVLLMERLVYSTSVMFGATGIRNVARPGGPFGSDHAYYYVVVVWAALALAAARWVRANRLGRLSTAIGEDVDVAAALGTSVVTARLVLFGLSAGMAGLGGALVAGGNESVSGSAFGALPSLLWLAVLTIAGFGVTSAPIRAALGLAVAPIYLASFIEDQQVFWFGMLAVAAAVVRARTLIRGAVIA